MPRRPSLRDHPIRREPESQGRESVYAPGEDQPSAVDRTPSQPETPKWDNHHKRVTFYCPLDLVARIETEVADSGRSKSRVIVDAVLEHLR